jgi:hypothetical protein
MIKPKHTLFLFCAVWLVLPFCLSVAAQTTAFTYQGRLNESSLPATGSYDFQFKLFDAPTGGTQIGSIQLSGGNSVAVTNGVFNVTLDFGVAAFPGAVRYLEISVRVAGGGAFTTLTPRRELNSVPYAVRGLNATSADSLSAACVICVTDAQIAALAGSKVTGTIPVAGVPAGSGNYIQNTTSPQSSSNFNISGNGTAGGTLSGNIVNATTQYNLNGSRVLSASSPAGLANLFAGFNAGVSNTTGFENTFIGSGAGIAHTSGNGNVFVGYNTGGTVTSACCNTFVGRAAGNVNTAANNSFFGYRAGTVNTTATNNAFFGSEAGQANTTGAQNTFVGRGAGLNNTTGADNSFFGAFAGESNTGGNLNTFIGLEAGKSNTTGGLNVFVGYRAGQFNTTGGGTYVGFEAGKANVTGGGNSMFGTQAGLNSTGQSNTFIGNAAGITNIAGSGNTTLGSEANVGVNNLTNATAVGNQARVNCSNCLVLGSVNGVNGATSNIAVGIGTTTPQSRLHVNGTSWFQGDITPLSSSAGKGLGLSYSTSLDAATVFAYDYATNTPKNILLNIPGGRVGIGTLSPSDMFDVSGDIRVGTGSTGCVKDADGSLIAGSCSSDLRFKQRIMPFPNLLHKLTQLQPVHFYWRAAEYPEKHFGSKQSYGLIAQEVEQVLPELVTTDEQGYQTVNYSKLPLLTIQAVKELKAENDALKAQNAKLLEQSEALKKENAAIEARLAALEKLLQPGAPGKK